MCGRYAATLPPEMMVELFRLLNKIDFPPRYNITPTQPIAAIWQQEGQRTVQLVRWGLDPGLGQGPAHLPAGLQRPQRRHDRKARLPRRHQAHALRHPGERLLRVDEGRERQAPPLLHHPRQRRADGLRRPLLQLDGPQRRGAGHRRDRHRRAQPRDLLDLRPHARDPARRGDRGLAQHRRGRRAWKPRHWPSRPSRGR